MFQSFINKCFTYKLYIINKNGTFQSNSQIISFIIENHCNKILISIYKIASIFPLTNRKVESNSQYFFAYCAFEFRARKTIVSFIVKILQIWMKSALKSPIAFTIINSCKIEHESCTSWAILTVLTAHKWMFFIGLANHDFSKKNDD